MNGRLSFVFSLIGLVSAQAFAEVYQAPHPEPTDEETLLLEWHNRFRMRPAKEAAIILAHDEWYGINRAEFEAEFKALKPSPPLAFNLRLLDSARKHAHWSILNKFAEGDETPGSPGYTGLTVTDRARYAGFPGTGKSGSLFHSPNFFRLHSIFIVDWKAIEEKDAKRPSRMQMLDPFMWEVGVAILRSGNEYVIGRDFGERKTARIACGVAYIDANKNNSYDLKEGAGSIVITASDGAATSTWRSGAYAFDLGTANAVTLSAEFAGQKFTQAFAAGAENIKFDLLVPAELMNKHADSLIAAVNNLPPDPRKKLVPVLNLHIQTRGLPLDADRSGRIKALTEKDGAAFDASQAAVREAFAKNDVNNFARILNDNRKPYAGTPFDKWFTDCAVVMTMRPRAAAVEAQRYNAQQRKALSQELEATAKTITTGEFSSEARGMIDRVKNPQSARR